MTKFINDYIHVVDLGSRDKLINISKLKRYLLKSTYSPAPLNASVKEFKPGRGLDSTRVGGDRGPQSRSPRNRLKETALHGAYGPSSTADSRGHTDCHC